MKVEFLTSNFIYLYLFVLSVILWFKDSKHKEWILIFCTIIVSGFLVTGHYFESFTSDRFVDFNISNYSRLVGVLSLFTVVFYLKEKYYLDRLMNFILLPISYIFVTTDDVFIMLGSVLATKSILLGSMSKNISLKNLKKYKIMEMISVGFLFLFAVFFSLSVKSPIFVDVEVDNFQLFSVAMVFLMVSVIEISGGIFMGLRTNILTESTGPVRNLYFFYGLLVILYKLILVMNNLLIEAEPDFQRNMVAFIKYYAPINFFLHNFLSINQPDVKKFFSRIISSLLGLVLMSVIIVKSGSIKAELIYYLISLMLSNILIFEIYDNANQKLDGVINDNPFDSLYRRNKIATVILLLAVLNLVGVPFTYGFSSKFFFLLNYFQEGHVYPMLIILLSSVIVLPDVMRVISSLFSHGKDVSVIYLGWNKVVFFFLFALLIIVFGVYPKIYF